MSTNPAAGWREAAIRVDPRYPVFYSYYIISAFVAKSVFTLISVQKQKKSQ